MQLQLPWKSRHKPRNALTVCQPQQSRHGPRRTYCDGSRVIPFEMTAHKMGCDDDKASPS